MKNGKRKIKDVLIFRVNWPVRCDDSMQSVIKRTVTGRTETLFTVYTLLSLAKLKSEQVTCVYEIISSTDYGINDLALHLDGANFPARYLH